MLEQQVENDTGEEKEAPAETIVEVQMTDDDLFWWLFGQGWAWTDLDSTDMAERTSDNMIKLSGDDEQYAFLYNFFLTYQDELFLPDEPLYYNDIWLRPDPVFDSRQYIVLKDFPLRMHSPWRLLMYYRNIDDDSENELVMVVESVDFNAITTEAIMLVDDRTYGYALLDVLRPYFMTSDINHMYLFDFAKEHRGKIVNFRSKDAINIVALSHPPAKSFFGIDFYILEIRGGKIKTIFDYNNLYIEAYDYYFGGVFESEYQRAVNMYKDTTGDSSVDDLGGGELRLIDYATPSFEDRDNDGNIEIIIEGTENLLKAKNEQVDTSTFYPEDWEVLLPISNYKKIYTWDEATEQYILQSEAGTEYVNLD
jgi:hypothetical protein